MKSRVLYLVIVAGMVCVSLRSGAQGAIDPVLTTDPADLTTAQVAKMQETLADWGQLGRYRLADSALPPHATGRVVFYGDSITDGWQLDQAFPGKSYINRGISGQTTPQMLVRFEQDVVELHPAAVLILAGTNDIAGNTGYLTVDMIEANFRAMSAIAQASAIRVILASTLPTDGYPWRPGIQPAGEIRLLNHWLEKYCMLNGFTYLDYYTALASPDGGMRTGLSRDGVHPNAAGYAMMAPLADAAIERTLHSH